MSNPTKYISIGRDAGLSNLFTDHISEIGSYAAVFSEIEKKCMANKEFPNRRVLVDCLTKQYKESGIELGGLVHENIKALADTNTFTVTTGHQLCVFSGPLYVIHKILSAVHTCNELNRINKKCRFVPVYWMATEDHDIEEISHLNIFREKFSVEFSSSGTSGMLNSGDVIKHMDRLKELAGDLPFAGEILDIINDCYRDGVLLKHAHRKFIHALMGQLGIVILDGDEPALKKIFRNVFHDELTNQVVTELVTVQNKELAKKGYAPQVNSRAINLFLLSKGARNRIEKDGENFILVDTNRKIKKEEMVDLVNNQPETISPNVLLRPLYQCTVLPDVALVGGPAEIGYWRQLDKLFEKYNVVMPLRIPRLFAFYVNDKQYSLYSEIEKEKLGLFSPETEWASAWAKKQAAYASFEKEKKELDSTYASLSMKASEVDKSLIAFIASEKSRSEKFLTSLDEKIIRSLKKNSENEMNALHQLHVKLFPEGSWQERHESALPYLWKYGKNFVNEILAEMPASVNHCALINK
ncbi:MAG: bacillithiol biosynthesis cysteine-adding enzyme BshC [Flavobacteriales bacterium]